MSKTKKKLNDNNVTEVTFLCGRVAVIFSFSFGLLGEPVSNRSLWRSWHYYRETVWTLTPQPAESWENVCTTLLPVNVRSSN